ncbi:two-component system response regulator YesN [Hydrogenispora ethanolica]|uniref:Two-component system response regulator YesN n=1 Tax=Hydrogenispora ethanolica TaxID=1082276 RepID=A0A4R1SB03_HYDET|nr:response regulator [Hydrogenispora ethanolica]TCL76559.1 two-component system response regulator YesN [Hydrogenispora ethanolica]
MNSDCKLLIVDDDEIIRAGLTRNIPWEAHGFTVVGAARNGAEGLDLAREHRPQLILSDIRMPFMDGLQMAEAVKAGDPGVKVIFLTGYDEFEYARKALNLKASDYILKYADNEEILQAVIKAGEEWREEQQLQGMVDQSQRILKEKLLRELLLAEEPTPDLAKRVKDLGLELAEEERFSVAAIGCEAPGNGRAATGGDFLADFCRERLAAAALPGEVVALPKRIILILGVSEAEFPGQEPFLAGLLQSLAERWREGKIAIGVGDIHQGPEGIAHAYQEAEAALETQTALGPAGIAYFRQIGESENQQRLRKILDYVRNHFDDPDLTLAKLAKEVNICPAYISTIFKKYQKIKFSDYLIAARMEKARELLAKTNLMTYEVAERTGYPNPQYFSVLFKKYTGMTPTEFKNSRHPA